MDFNLAELVIILLLTAIFILLALYVLVWLRDRRTSSLGRSTQARSRSQYRGLMRGMTQSHTVNVTQIDGQQQIIVNGIRYTEPEQILDPRLQREVRQVISLVDNQKGTLSPLADHEVRIKWLGEADAQRRRQVTSFVTDQGEPFAIEVDGRTYHDLAEIKDPQVREGVRLLADQARRLTSQEGLRLGRASIAFDLEIQIEGQTYYDVDDIPDPDLREEVRAILLEPEQAGGVEEVKIIQIGGKTYQRVEDIPDPVVRQEMRRLLNQAQQWDQE
ncbi:MAG: hypothetical protein KKA73_21390 [Chloroflexi bacterium]|nr:hypothetical protein [Chloroflexota bacterium]MBU1750248.1 hypothetical protein [Chloroflexota bacterium]MBU1878519.1 hypothetical protein [Chloroflexota bacterium]